MKTSYSGKNNRKTKRLWLSGLILPNNNGNYYRPGISYDYVLKCKVADKYFQCLQEKYPEVPTVSYVAEKAGVSHGYA